MAEAFKNLFNKKLVEEFANNIYKYDSSFRKEEYTSFVLSKLEELELKDRMRLISSSIDPFLDADYKKTIEILKKVKTHFSQSESMGLQSMILPDYVEVYGLDDFETSINALEYFTIDSSSEFAIRHFIVKYEKETMEAFMKWAKNENEHIRRLSSEGCRPRLPWAIALPVFKKNPTLVLEVLELLKHDDSMYVRKSVANNLNDISKDNPELVIKFVKDNLGFSKNLDWICKHASRTLLKAGDKKILELFGYKADNSFIIENFIVDLKVKEEENLNFSFDLKTTNDKIGNVRIEYAIDYQKANKTLSRKVFMLSQNEINKSSKSFKKYQSFKKVTTRKYHKGLHKIAIIVNGEEKIIREFELI
ncbi:MAG: DNA alkylation repair protein [Arcobacter sp.]|nr:MAG: DNA alkylation repair protein [Arcobacter sp.]